MTYWLGVFVKAAGLYICAAGILPRKKSRALPYDAVLKLTEGLRSGRSKPFGKGRPFLTGPVHRSGLVVQNPADLPSTDYIAHHVVIYILLAGPIGSM